MKLFSGSLFPINRETWAPLIAALAILDRLPWDSRYCLPVQSETWMRLIASLSLFDCLHCDSRLVRWLDVHGLYNTGQSSYVRVRQPILQCFWGLTASNLSPYNENRPCCTSVRAVSCWLVIRLLTVQRDELSRRFKHKSSAEQDAEMTGPICPGKITGPKRASHSHYKKKRALPCFIRIKPAKILATTYSRTT
jgi:hypothetical protein